MPAVQERPPKVRLRRSDLSVPGIRRVRHGRGFRYLDEDGAAVDGPRGPRAHPRARHPARVAGRVDQPVPRRAHPGHRHRPGGPQAVPLPPALARAARPREVRRHGPVRPGAARAARARRRPDRARRPLRGARAGRRRAPARPRLLPHRLRGLRRAQRDLRAGDDEEAPRPPRRRHAALRLPGQARQAPRAGRRGPRGRGDASTGSSAAGGAATSCSPTRRARPLDRRQVRRHQPLPEGRHGPGRLGQGLPDVGRDGPRRRRPVGQRRGAARPRRRP